jgi:nitrogen regulatory protein PII
MYNYQLMKKAILSTILVLICAFSQGQSYKQHPLFIYSFTRYVQWPEGYNQGDFEILILGDSPLMDELKLLAQNKKVGDRTIKIIKINSVAEIRKCNMLFIPADKSDKLGEVLQKVGAQSVLVMTEQTGLGAQGSCINFISKEGKLAFELNQSAFLKQNLKASNELTRLATMI